MQNPIHGLVFELIGSVDDKTLDQIHFLGTIVDAMQLISAIAITAINRD